MPGIRGRDMSAGPWVNPNRTRAPQPKHSTIVCPVCGYPLHLYLVADGIRVHPLCDPRPLRSIQ
jgi:hypothetical protein